jgi:hypothetical protein
VAAMILRILDDIIEFNGLPVARLLPHLSATTVYRLKHVLEDASDDLEEIRDLLNALDDDEPTHPRSKPNLVLVSSNPGP